VCKSCSGSIGSVMVIIPGERHGLHVIFSSSAITDAMTASLPMPRLPRQGALLYAAMAKGRSLQLQPIERGRFLIPPFAITYQHDVFPLVI